MAQNFLYMFEFVVDDLLITRPNHCAPEEYPTCCEISFRSSVFVSICDREFGQCVDTCAPKCGKCCLFSLESPVTEKDRLLIHIYKKRNEKCKFLVGATDLPIKPLFDKVTETFNIENPNWMEQLAKHIANMPDPKTPSKTLVDNDCDDELAARREQMCPTSELTKRLLPLFSMKGVQTGNLVLIMRLVCNGPTIVSSFPFSRMCNQNCNTKKPKPCPSFPESPESTNGRPAIPCGTNNNNQKPAGGYCTMPDPCKKEDAAKTICRRYFACNAEKGCPCEECEDECDRPCPTVTCFKKCKPKKPPCCPTCQPICQPQPPRTTCQPQSCKPKKEEKNDPQRYFAPAPEKCCCPCDECVDECEADAEECSEETSEVCIPPCFINPTKPDPGPDAYEEFEACLNGSGLVIRVLKDTHQVQSINDGTDAGNIEDDYSDECCERGGNEGYRNCESLSNLLQSSNFARNHIKRRTTGHIINHPKLPKIRANIKYAGQDACPSERFRVPFTKIKNYCDGLNRLDSYRRKTTCEEQCGMQSTGATDNRNCCLQVDPEDIKNTLKGINVDTRKKGIEVCYKTCDDTDSDVFLVKLGSKHRCQKKKNSIEIELKTPKQPIILPVQKITTETQINEAELDAALSGVCGKGKKKGGKKGKK